MTPLFLVAIALTTVVIGGLGLTLRALQARAHAEAAARAPFDEFDAALARCSGNANVSSSSASSVSAP